MRLTSYRSPRGRQRLLNTTKIWEAGRATSAVSPFFDSITIGDFGESLVDGATGANNPVYEVWNEAQDIWPSGSLEDKIKCLVSIGTGVPSLTPFKDDLIGIGQSLMAIATEMEKTTELFSRDKSSLDDKRRYYRFNVLRGLEDIGLEDLKRKNAIIAATDRYIESQAVFKQMKACADSMSGREYTELTNYASSPRKQESQKADARSEDMFNKFTGQALNALQYSAMTERFEGISEAHKQTFSWAYDRRDKGNSWNSFAKWLESQAGIYWIRGKPGSGKSCLVKYLSDNPKTKQFLRSWSGSVPIVIAGFFFWYAGTDMQKSQNGLLRSILFQILEQRPKLIPVAYPNQWKYYQRGVLNQWEHYQLGVDVPFTNNMEELIGAISNITNQAKFPMKLCLFIDGLGEYNGNHSEIVQLFKTVATAPSTKLCISSRPWPVFLDAFKPYPGLILQDLTKGDITEYVQSRLEECPGMKALQLVEPEEAPLLIQEIVDKASGVFLWVRLVVTSLLSGLTNNDHIVDLKRRVEELPEELEELYSYMLKRIDPFYLAQALQLLHLAQYSRRPLPSR